MLMLAAVLAALAALLLLSRRSSACWILPRHCRVSGCRGNCRGCARICLLLLLLLPLLLLGKERLQRRQQPVCWDRAQQRHHLAEQCIALLLWRAPC